VPRIVLSAELLIDGATALRPWRDSDLRSIVAACQDPEIPRWTRVPSPYGESDARAHLLRRYDLLEAGVEAPFAIVDAGDDDHLLGSISLMEFNWEQERAEVGYWLSRDARGHGHVTRAVRLICVWGFERLRLARIALLAATANGASQRVAERAGFTREAVLRSYMRTGDGYQDMVVFALLSGEL
jgi:RimJ/RimL family protein N-acetyltransferase